VASDVVAVSYLEVMIAISSGVFKLGLYEEGYFLTSTTAVFEGSAEPEALKSLARDSRVTNSKSAMDMVDIVRVVG
jgi:hypothetical protein